MKWPGRARAFWAARRARGPYPYEGRFVLYVHPDDTVIGPTVAHNGWWAPFELNVMLPLLRPGDVVIDVGANIGTHVMPFSAGVGPRGQVLAFEPAKANVALLKRNVDRNGCKNVRIVPVALSDQVGMGRLHQSQGNAGAHSIIRGNVADVGDDEPVRFATLDSFLESLDGKTLRLIKMDVQGAEARVVGAGHRLIGTHRPAVFLEFVQSMLADAGAGVTNHIQWIVDQGYELFLIQESTEIIRSIDPLALVGIPEAHDNNVLLIPEEWHEELARLRSRGGADG